MLVVLLRSEIEAVVEFVIATFSLGCSCLSTRVRKCGYQWHVLNHNIMRNHKRVILCRPIYSQSLGPKITMTMGLEGHTEMNGPLNSLIYNLCVIVTRKLKNVGYLT